MKYKGWPLWREHGTLGGRWELEIFNEEGSTVVETNPAQRGSQSPGGGSRHQSAGGGDEPSAPAVEV